jgi:hypothetical protein
VYLGVRFAACWSATLPRSPTQPSYLPRVTAIFDLNPLSLISIYCLTVPPIVLSSFSLSPPPVHCLRSFAIQPWTIVPIRITLSEQDHGYSKSLCHITNHSNATACSTISSFPSLQHIRGVMIDPHRFQLKHVSCTSEIGSSQRLTHRDSISRDG